MGRKNKRMEPQSDASFEKFMKSINEKNKNKTSIYNNRSVEKVSKPVHVHKEMTREEKIISRTNYAEKMLTQNNIEHEVVDKKNGVILCRYKNGFSIKYYAFSGQIQNHNDIRGINSLISLLK